MCKVLYTGAELQGKLLNVPVLERVEQRAQDSIEEPYELHLHTWPRHVLLECRCRVGVCREVDVGSLCDVLLLRQTNVVDHALQHSRRECPAAEPQHKDFVARLVLLHEPLVAVQHVLRRAHAKVRVVVHSSGPTHAGLVLRQLQGGHDLLGKPPDRCDVGLAELGREPIARLVQLIPRAVIEDDELPTCGSSCAVLCCMCGIWRLCGSWHLCCVGSLTWPEACLHQAWVILRAELGMGCVTAGALRGCCKHCSGHQDRE
mmetsp:Transcript_11625/g.32773  ORF Transcript_11625/g.32773 Transcript_11625/m.32773 type:complete len:260 (-) Transcript_11625:85-864(-)